MYPVDDLFAAYAKSFDAHREAEMTLPEYLDACRDNPMVYATTRQLGERFSATVPNDDRIHAKNDRATTAIVHRDSTSPSAAPANAIMNPSVRS